MRYLWDVYDNHNDCDGDTYDANANLHYWQHFSMLGYYPSGTGTNQINEVWNSFLTVVTEPDGRGALSYEANYSNTLSVSTGTLRIDNCGPH